MGGREASRGFLYQAIAAMLVAFESDNWDKISVEFKTEDDKVDIALISEHSIIKAIQVKSSINAFKEAEVKKWLSDLCDDLSKSGKNVEEYEAYLIGVCEKKVADFTNALDKHYTNTLDAKATKALSNFDINKFGGKKITVSVKPFNLDSLTNDAYANIHKYASDKKFNLNAAQVELLVNAVITIKSALSTNGEEMDRISFQEKIDAWIREMKNQEVRESKTISIRSFSRATIEHDETDFPICFLDMFEERVPKEGVCWNENICKKLYEQLLDINDPSYSYRLLINAHLSLAFATGRFFDSKRGLEVFPLQRTKTEGIQSWKTDESQISYVSWEVRDEKKYTKYGDSLENVLVINATHDNDTQVEEFFQNEKIDIGRWLICNLPDPSKTIVNGNHARQLAEEIAIILRRRTTPEKRAMLHIFVSAPVGFMFYLGNISREFCNFTLYEYDYTQETNGTYSSSISFPNSNDRM